MDPSPSLEELLPVWLLEHGAVFRLDHWNETYFYRRLSRREYRLALMIEEEDERFDQIAESCLLWPQNWKAEEHEGDPAGIVVAISKSILNDSGCGDLLHTKTKYEQQILTDVESQAEAIIDHVFAGGGNFDKYQNWSHDQLFDSYARAKWISEHILGRPILEQKTEEQKRGRRPDGSPERPVIPDIDSGQMGLKPMHEVMERNRIARRQQAARNMGAQASSKPVRKPTPR